MPLGKHAVYRPQLFWLAQPYAPRLQCEVVRGHPNGTIISARYAFLLVDIFFPMGPQVRCKLQSGLCLPPCSHEYLPGVLSCGC